jgi:hypothetical protein
MQPRLTTPTEPNGEKEKHMNKLPVITTMVFLLAAAPAFAQMAGQTGQSSTMMSTMGKITAVDLQRRTLILDTGMQFTLAPTLQYTTLPALDQQVQVTYNEQGGQKVAQVIDLLPRGPNTRK